MNVSLYVKENTPIHRLDPRTKIVTGIIIFIIVLTFNDPRYLSFFLFATILLSFLSRSVKNLLRIKYFLIFLFFFCLLLWPFFVQGKRTLLTILGRPFFLESVLYAISMGLRLQIFVIIGMIYISTTKNEETTLALTRLKLPYSFSFAISMALRLVPTFVKEAATIYEAQILRGLNLESKNPLSRIRNLIPLAIPMFFSTVRSVNMLSIALEARGFDPQSERTSYMELKMKVYDFLVIFFFLILLAFCLFLRLYLKKGFVISGRL